MLLCHIKDTSEVKVEHTQFHMVTLRESKFTNKSGCIIGIKEQMGFLI